MKKIYLALSTMMVTLPIIFMSFTTGTFQEEDPYKKAEQQYAEYCIGCHFQPNEFMEKEWIEEKSVESAFTSIRYGMEDIGMPAFRGGLSDKDILNLSNYIINMGREADFRKGSDSDRVFDSESFSYRAVTVVENLDIPWGLTWLPGGEMLITERSGILYKVDKQGNRTEISGVPKVYEYGQGGLLDVELHPSYETNGWIYITYSYYAGQTVGDGGSTALMRARLKNDALTDKEILFRATPAERRGPHYGSRIEFDREGYLYLTVGDRGQSHNAQDITNYSGAVHRLHDDGTIPTDNPFYNTPNAVKSIYNYGHRNIQGLALHPQTGDLWSHEHGPRGGDELNIERPGINYGWPEITYGINYNGTIITRDTARAGMEQPVIYWTPSIAPCGMDFIDGDIYPGWEGDLLVGSLRFNYVIRCTIENRKVVHQEKLIDGLGRVRNVKVGPDGYIYVGLENPGRIVKLVPLD
ncbi:MAG: PQQ-dependent sugar dehydrogenase [Bacteroidales bacterium]